MSTPFFALFLSLFKPLYQSPAVHFSYPVLIQHLHLWTPVWWKKRLKNLSLLLYLFSAPYIKRHWARHLLMFILYILWKASSRLVLQRLSLSSSLFCVCVFVLRGSIVSSCSLGVRSDSLHSEDQVPCPAGLCFPVSHSWILWALWRSGHRSVTLPYDRKKHQPGGLSITRTDGKFNVHAML